MSVHHLETPFFFALRAQTTHTWDHAVTVREAMRGC
jgi:hypothetical protein